MRRNPDSYRAWLTKASLVTLRKEQQVPEDWWERSLHNWAGISWNRVVHLVTFHSLRVDLWWSSCASLDLEELGGRS